MSCRQLALLTLLLLPLHGCAHPDSDPPEAASATPAVVAPGNATGQNVTASPDPLIGATPDLESEESEDKDDDEEDAMDDAGGTETPAATATATP